MTRPAPTVTSADLRPRARWYAYAAVVAVVGVAVGVLVFFVRFEAWTGEFPQLGERHRVGRPIPVELRAGVPVVLYVSPDAHRPLTCEGEVAGSPVGVTDPSYTFTFFSGGSGWEAALEFEADVDGTGTVTCAGSPAVSLAVGERPDNGRLLRILAGVIALGAVPAVLGLGGGAALAIGVRRRRRAHRAALLAARS